MRAGDEAMSDTEAKTKKKRNSFSAALDAACKRYGQATKEREQAVRKLDALNLEIPQLQETIKVLQKQTGGRSGSGRELHN